METKKRRIILPIILNIVLTVLLITSLFLCIKLNNEANKIDMKYTRNKTPIKEIISKTITVI